MRWCSQHFKLPTVNVNTEQSANINFWVINTGKTVLTSTIRKFYGHFNNIMTVRQGVA